MENITKEQQWVSINDRLPDIKKKVLIYVSSDNDKLTGLHVGHRMPGDNFWIISGKFSFDVGDVTHWTTLPQLPASGSVAAPKEEVTLGVGDGSGQHFVSGSYDTIKLLQGKLIELESYRLSYTFEEDGETGLSLLDRLTPPGDTDISRGRDEIQLLTEEIELLYSKELTSLRQQLKEREEALKEFAQILLDYKHSGVEVNIDYLLDKFPYENIEGKI